MEDNEKIMGYTADQLTDTEFLAKMLNKIPKQKRMLVTMSTIAFISGMETQASIGEGAR